MDRPITLTDSYNDTKENFKLIIKVRFVAGIVILVSFGIIKVLGVLDFNYALFAIAPLFEMFINQPYKVLITLE